MTGHDLPSLVTEVPGPRSRGWVDRLAAHECPAITARRARRAAALSAAHDDPIVWDEAVGANVRDVDGNVFVDFTSGFGVCSVGHRHPAVIAAGQAQLGRLPHAMGDAFPDPSRVRLLERLAELSGLPYAILGSSGSDAVEAALKTARLATGRDGVLSFAGGYHGLSYGGLTVTAFNAEEFRAPFAGQLGGHSQVAPYGGELPSLSGIGAVVVEPLQGRGGMREAPWAWLVALREACDRDGAMLVFDEIYSGFGRAGRTFAFERSGVRPDLLCVGKALAGGFPISACLGTARAMEAWGASRGYAIHTQTFLGNPTGCAMALACLDVVVSEALPARAERLGARLAAGLSQLGPVRGAGLMRGVVLDDALGASRRLLRRGYLALPCGERAEVLAVIPPLTVDEALLDAFVAALGECS